MNAHGSSELEQSRCHRGSRGAVSFARRMSGLRKRSPDANVAHASGCGVGERLSPNIVFLPRLCWSRKQISSRHFCATARHLSAL